MSIKNFFSCYTSDELQAMHDSGTFEARKAKFDEVRTIDLKSGQHPDDAYFFYPQERDIRKVASDWNRLEALTDIATNGGQHEAINEAEIDILIEDKLNI